MRNRRLIYTATFLRALANGMVGVLLAIYLTKLNLNVSQIGFIISTGLGGAALTTLLATFWGDRVGRRWFLISIAVVSAAGGMMATFTSKFTPMILVAFFGMLNGMGKDRGASLVVETAILPTLQTEKKRTQAFAWHTAMQDLGQALGSILAALPTVLSYFFHTSDIVSLKIPIGLYSLLLGMTALIYFCLSPDVEASASHSKPKLSQHSKHVLWKISSLFAIDSLAGGFLTSALLSYFFYERFGVSAGSIGLLFFFARTLNALSHFGAAWLSKYIGLVNTMVFTHIPSSIFLMTVAFAPNFTVAAILFLLREAFVEMDVPTRQSYVMAIMKPETRTFAAGITHVVRMAGWAVAPAFAGMFMHAFSLGIPLFIGAAMKILYDILLYTSFRKLKPPEEGGNTESF